MANLTVRNGYGYVKTPSGQDVRLGPARSWDLEQLKDRASAMSPADVQAAYAAQQDAADKAFATRGYRSMGEFLRDRGR